MTKIIEVEEGNAKLVELLFSNTKFQDHNLYDIYNHIEKYLPCIAVATDDKAILAERHQVLLGIALNLRGITHWRHVANVITALPWRYSHIMYGWIEVLNELFIEAYPMPSNLEFFKGLALGLMALESKDSGFSQSYDGNPYPQATDIAGTYWTLLVNCCSYQLGGNMLYTAVRDDADYMSAVNEVVKKDFVKDPTTKRMALVIKRLETFTNRDFNLVGREIVSAIYYSLSSLLDENEKMMLLQGKPFVEVYDKSKTLTSEILK
ncbi:MAG: hypothetical protein WC621_02545 [Patescibacteria group bacterium]